MQEENQIVISLGGSLIVPDDVDSEFIKKFVAVIKEYTTKGFSFLIITGGGKTCRKYNESLKKIIDASYEQLDWLGISITRVNAELIKACLGDLAYEKVVLDPNTIPNTDKKVIVGGGWKPGNSSDLAAVCGAENIGAKKLINLSNIDYVYEKDPKKFPEAKPIKEISWNDFRQIIPKEWGPGINSPFDPVAAKRAEELSLEVIIMNGKNIENFKSCLSGSAFVGTVIK